MMKRIPVCGLVALLTLLTSWTVEAEDPATTVTWRGDQADIVAPKGLSLWCDDLMRGNTVIEYEAQIVSDSRFPKRVSDLNCFFLSRQKGGVGAAFVRNYAHTLYYLGYGGNWNTTTRFRRYDGDTTATRRPAILREYTDAAHLLRPGHWYRIRLEVIDGRVRCYVDGECIVDWLDPQPLQEGYFAFRTTFAHARLRHFRYTCTDPDTEPLIVRDINATHTGGPVTFGVPLPHAGDVAFQPRAGHLPESRTVASDRPSAPLAHDVFSLTTPDGRTLDYDTWPLASWPDGSPKWQAFATVVPQGCDTILIKRAKGVAGDVPPSAHAGALPPSARPQGAEGAASPARPFYITINNTRRPVLSHTVEQAGAVRTVHRYEGRGFTVRTYHYRGSSQTKLVHTLHVDSALAAEGLRELSLHFPVPMHGAAHQRTVSFGKAFAEPVQPLIARHGIRPGTLDNIARWDGYRLTQLTPNAFSVRKRATSRSPYIGTVEGFRHDGTVAVADTTATTTFRLDDFWQSYPAALAVDNARADTAEVVISLYAPQAEPYSFCHYDTIAHTLDDAYEDVQPGMSTAWGIARTSTIYIDEGQAAPAPVFLPTPEYLHRCRAFGIWSLPTRDTPRHRAIEERLDSIMCFYRQEIDRNAWYGYFNYGDVMHTGDTPHSSLLTPHSSPAPRWRYDVGGYAWDNTELASPAMFWAQFLRTGDPDVWRMATAMTRHCSEVDTYHTGPFAGLGSRHNVVHWGCGAKESRIAEAWWNRYMYYLTADERLGDIMHAVVDSDTLLYHLDPMRLAQPRSLFPCTAPARLRIGPDWTGYVSNWLTEYERTGNQRYMQKTLTGMASIACLHDGFFTGPKALGYYPDTGRITCECDTTVRSTNHLMFIMGGFELMNELEAYTAGNVEAQPFWRAYLDLCRRYKPMAHQVAKSKFLIPRLTAYAAWRTGDTRLARTAWHDLWHANPLAPPNNIISTNDAATWTLDAVFLKEVLP